MSNLKSPCCSSRTIISKPPSCSHLRAYKENGGIENFHTVQQYLQTCSMLLVTPAKIPTIKCMLCPNQNEGGRLHVCLQCVFFGCWIGGHLSLHFKETNHFLAVEVKHQKIFCNHCGDYVYDSDFDIAAAKEKTKAVVIKKRLLNIDNTPNRVNYFDWVPTKTEAENLIKGAKRYIAPTHLLGLRGLNNLGNTCFMNSILQALLHNPLLRNFFLSDLHNKKYCKHRLNPEKRGICLACEMDFLFSEFFSGVRTPYTPHRFLHSVWKYSNYFAGYEQQDAHEFLISSLNGIHSDCDGTSKDCRCVIHQIFNGVLRSDVTCAKCDHTSTAFDPFFDISLDLDKKKKDDPESTENLLQSLERFTQPEHLGSEEKFLCGKCNSYQESIKQFSMHVVPVVLCLHIKRFEHASMKLDTFIEFPETLDISPYLSTNILSKRALANGSSLQMSEKTVEKYDLFAVVNHHGRMDNGHYISYIRHSNSWFKCDDAWITKVSLQQVLKSKGYLLFYIQRHFEYSRLK